MPAFALLDRDAFALIMRHTDRVGAMLTRLCLVDKATHRCVLTEVCPIVLISPEEELGRRAVRVHHLLERFRADGLLQISFGKLLSHDARRPHREAERTGQNVITRTANGFCQSSRQHANP